MNYKGLKTGTIFYKENRKEQCFIIKHVNLHTFDNQYTYTVDAHPGPSLFGHWKWTDRDLESINVKLYKPELKDYYPKWW